MSPSADTPVYNLKAVVRETGLKPDTIRAWERRYGLPEPRRTDSGHRLYSQNEINMLKWLIARQTEGMSISRAVVLWQRLRENGDDPGDLSIYESALTPAPIINQNPVPATADTLTQLRNSWLNACMNFDEQTAERVLAQAFAIFPVETVCTELIQRSLAAIGEGWYQGRITVQQEHFASALSTRRLEALLAATPAPTRPNRILIGCPPEETHTLAPMLLALLLRRRGWDVIFLGANMPFTDLIDTIRKARPQVVILVAQQLSTAATLMQMGHLLVNERVPMAFGGRIFTQISELRHRIPGHYLGDHIETAPQTVENILAAPRIQTALQLVSHEYQEALRHFKAHLAQIEAEVWQRVGASHTLYNQLARANESTSRNVIAALTLGNINFLQPDLDWIRDLLQQHYEMPEQALTSYLQIYAEAVERHLGSRGHLISKWLRGMIENDFLAEMKNLAFIQSKSAPA